MRALLAPIGALADAHPLGAYLAAGAVVLASFALVAALSIADRRSHRP